jgi:hypothetical protein
LTRPAIAALFDHLVCANKKGVEDALERAISKVLCCGALVWKVPRRTSAPNFGTAGSP